MNGDPLSATYEITALTIALGAGGFGTSDIAVPFNSAATCIVSDIDITVT